MEVVAGLPDRAVTRVWARACSLPTAYFLAYSGPPLFFPTRQVSADKLALLKVRALSELIWALACWGYTPTQEWLKVSSQGARM